MLYFGIAAILIVWILECQADLDMSLNSAYRNSFKTAIIVIPHF